MPKRATRSGTQSIERAIRILKAVAERGEIGWRPTDIAEYCGLEKTTAHRMLKSLAAERLLRQRAGDRRYIPGPMLFELASALPAYMGFRDAMHDELVTIARRHNCYALLHLKSGVESVCIDRVGTSRVHPLTIVGTRRPLTESTAGVAMLLAMPKKQRDQALEAIQKASRAQQATRRATIYKRILDQSRQAGCAYSEGDVVPGLGAVAVAIADASGKPCIAIGVMGSISQVAGERLAKTAAALHKDARRIGREFAQHIAALKTELDGE